MAKTRVVIKNKSRYSALNHLNLVDVLLRVGVPSAACVLKFRTFQGAIGYILNFGVTTIQDST